jgi:hypothetical protein
MISALITRLLLASETILRPQLALEEQNGKGLGFVGQLDGPVVDYFPAASALSANHAIQGYAEAHRQIPVTL